MTDREKRLARCDDCGEATPADIHTCSPQRLAQPEQEPVAGEPLPCPFCGASDGLTMTDGSTYRWGYAYCSNCGASAGETRRAYPDDGKWYQDAIQQWNQRTTPPRREWVGLTEEEIEFVYADTGYNDIQMFALAIEAKLREKNHV